MAIFQWIYRTQFIHADSCSISEYCAKRNNHPPIPFRPLTADEEEVVVQLSRSWSEHPFM